MAEPGDPDYAGPELPDNETREKRIELSIAYIVDGLKRAAPAGWRRIDLRSNITLSVSDARLRVFVDDTIGQPMEMPEQGFGALREHRHLSWTPERGTWLSARIMLTPDQPPFVSFNWDHLPDWSPTVPPEVYREDFEFYPRPAVPAWLETI
ncbi:hypothetical protein [Nocardia sp. NPDC051832]|uniref:hypothetical protein n=1 Tax=Nocardia sp. NPDC051832 TaxID=3155673 RepID=UPI0034146411